MKIGTETTMDPGQIKREPEFFIEDFKYQSVNGIKIENQENGDISSEHTLVSVSLFFWLITEINDP